MTTSVLRNQPCPCGSGKRYKACCGSFTADQITLDDPVEMVVRANALMDAGDLPQAKVLFTAAFQRNPKDAETALALGIIAHYQEKPQESEQWLKKALALNPDDVELHDNIGVMLLEMFALTEAQACFERVLAMEPERAGTLGNLGNTYKMLREFRLAEQCFRRMLDLQPDNAAGWNGLANVLFGQAELAAACDAYEQAMRLMPDAMVYSNWLLALNYRADVNRGTLYRHHLGFGGCVSHARLAADSIDAAGRRLRIGYVSGDFSTHAAFAFIRPVLAAHDRTRFEVHAFFTQVNADDNTDRLRGEIEHWHNIAALSDAEAAAKILNLGIDILVDLSGHTAGNRLPLFAQKPAPRQVSWLGYGNTVGLDEIDYLLTDAVSSPPDDGQRFRETLLRLPHSRLCYQPLAGLPPVTPPPVLRNGYITFGCFNNPAKLNEPVLRLWAQILAGQPTARLVLKPFQGATERAHWQERLAAAGIDPARVELRPASSYNAMLEEYADIDIALDPFPFTGGATTCDALICGVPVITLRGQTLIGRQSASLLTAAGLADGIADHAAAYVELALRWAESPEWLAQRRAGQRRQVLDSALCDARAFARALEALYEQMATA